MKQTKKQTKQGIKRRSFLKKAAAGTAGVAAATVAAPAIAQGRQDVVMVSTWPRDLASLGTNAQRFAQRLTDMSDGRLNVQYFAANERVKAFDSFDEVASGNAQIYHAAEYYWKGKHPGFSYFASVPFGMIAPECDAWIAGWAARSCGTSSGPSSESRASSAEPRGCRWAAGSGRRCTRSTTSRG